MSATAATTGELASGDRDVALTVDDPGDGRAPSAEVLVHLFRDLGEEVDGAHAAHVRDEGVPATAATTGGLASGDRDVALTVDDPGDSRAPSAEILVHPLQDPGEEVDGALAAHVRDEGVFTTAATTGELASGDRDVALTVDDPGDGRAPSAEILVHPLQDPGEKVDGALAAHARDEGVPVPAATTGGLASGDRDVALTVDDQGDGRAPSAEILVHPLQDLGEKVDGALAAHARDEGVSATAATTGELASGDRDVALMSGRPGARKRAKLRVPTYALTLLILFAAGSGFLWQWWQSFDSSEADRRTQSEAPLTATILGSTRDEQPIAASALEANKAKSEPEPEPEPKEAVLEREPKKQTSKAPARKLSRSAVASDSAPPREIEPPAVALAPEPAPAPPPPPAKTATLVFDVSPWGEIYVDGKRHGTTPPLATVALPPGRHRIELRNPAQPSYVTFTTLEPGDVQRIRHHFE